MLHLVEGTESTGHNDKMNELIHPTEGVSHLFLVSGLGHLSCLDRSLPIVTDYNLFPDFFWSTIYGRPDSVHEQTNTRPDLSSPWSGPLERLCDQG